MGWIGAGITAAAAIYGDQVSASGAASANAIAMDINDKDLAYNSAQAQVNRRFQQEMSDTAMTRRVQDLKNANLNPALAYQLGGASQPTGSAASAPGIPNIQNTGAAYGRLGDQVGSAMDLKSQQARIDNLNAQTDKTNYETGNVLPQEAKNLQSQTGLNDQRAREAFNTVKMMDMLLAPRSTFPGADNRSTYEVNMDNDMELRSFRASIANLDLATQAATYALVIKARNDVNTATSVGARNITNASDGAFGRLMAYWNLSQPAISTGVQAAGVGSRFAPSGSGAAEADPLDYGLLP